MGRRGTWNRRDYPAQWEQMAGAAKERAGWRCERCGVRHGQMAVNRHGVLYVVRLAAAHVHHDAWKKHVCSARGEGHSSPG